MPLDWQPRNGKCGVTIDVFPDDVQETSSFGAIKDRAAKLMQTCVIHDPHFGGWSVVGEEGNLFVEVFGTTEEEEGRDCYCFSIGLD